MNWITGDAPGEWQAASAQIRHRHSAARGHVRATRGDGAEFVFEEPQLAVAPGQAVVFYERDLVIGGGWID